MCKLVVQVEQSFGILIIFSIWSYRTSLTLYSSLGNFDWPSFVSAEKERQREREGAIYWERNHQWVQSNELITWFNLEISSQQRRRRRREKELPKWFFKELNKTLCYKTVFVATIPRIQWTKQFCWQNLWFIKRRIVNIKRQMAKGSTK